MKKTQKKVRQKHCRQEKVQKRTLQVIDQEKVAVVGEAATLIQTAVPQVTTVTLVVVAEVVTAAAAAAATVGIASEESQSRNGKETIKFSAIEFSDYISKRLISSAKLQAGSGFLTEQA